MNMYLQIALGIVPAILIFTVLSIFKKKGRIFNLICCGVLFVGAFAIACMGLRTSPAQQVEKKESNTRLSLVYAAALEERGGEIARKMLEELRVSQPDSGELSYCDALMRAASGDAIGAKALYAKASELGGGKNDEFLTLCDAVFQQDGTADVDAKEELIEFAKENMEQKVESDVFFDVAEAMVASGELFTKYVASNELDLDAAKDLFNTLDDSAEELPALDTIEMFRVMQLKLQVLLGDFDEIAESAREDMSYSELAIISELIIGGVIKESSFTDEFGNNFKVMAEAVAQQMVKTVKKIQDAAVKKDADALIKRFEQMGKSPAIYRIVDGLTQIAKNTASPDRSKAYLQLAKFEHEEGNAQQAEDYITSAMETVGITEDDDYFEPMSKLVEIVTDDDNPEMRKQIADFVEQATNHSSDEVVINAVEDAKKNEQNTEENQEEQKTEFENTMTDVVNQTRIKLDITGVDASEFETVNVTINITDALAENAEELKSVLKVTDCGIEITDFTVEKVEFTASNILLCCDVSGSMDGSPIKDLRDAVVKFIETSPEKENVALVTFADGVKDVHAFGTTDENLLSAAQNIYASGGTDMYNAIIRCLSEFTNDPKQVNYILLLSDGQDNTQHGIEDMEIEIGDPARNANILLYSLGLGGGVDSAYMSNLATVTGGDYLYVTDSETLATFYEKLRNQAMNRYTISFKAQDTFTSKRIVEVAYTEQPGIVQDSYTYYIGEEAEGGAENYYISMEGRSINSLSANLLYKSPTPTKIQIFGSGFKADDALGVKLDGALDYGEVTCTYVNEKTLEMIVPGGVACGEYDVRITVNGKTAIMKKALHVVAQGSEKTTAFGPYVFTSYSKAENGDTITLDNHVSMNGWLSFNGDVTLTGDLTMQSITLVDYEGCYVRYNPSTAEGYAATIANRGEVVELGALGTVILYNNPDMDPSSDDYMVNKVCIPELLLPNLLMSEMPSMALYPNKILIDMTGFNTDLPFQDVLVKSTDKKLFAFDAGAKLTISNVRLDLEAEAEIKTDPEKGKFMASVGKISVPIFKGSMKMKLDTSKGMYGFEFDVEIPALFNKTDTGLGLALEWEARKSDEGIEKLCPSKVQFKVDYPVKTNIGGVPITLSDFKLGLEGIDPNKSILDCKFVGSMDIGLSKVSDYISGLDEHVGDVSLLKLDETTLTLGWSDCYIGLKTKLTLLDKIEIGSMEIEAGRLPFNVLLLGIKDQEAYGMRASVSEGIKWDTKNCDVNITGTGTVSVNPKLFSIEYKGEAHIDIQWWIFSPSFHAEGNAVVGFYIDEQGRFNFAVIARKSNASGSKEYYLTWNKDTDLEMGRRKV